MRAQTTPVHLNKEEKKIVRLAALGGMLEFYDFIIYGIFSIYFAEQFFPSTNPVTSIIKSYGVFVLGYVARPIGGIFFSYLGDKYGRKYVLILTIALMGLSSLGIGFLPNYSHIGIAAPISLLLLRLIQGLALGGELPSTYVYITESMPKKRGSGFGLTMSGVKSGLLLGTIINEILNLILSPAEITAYGWRIPFILGGIICIISYRVRQTLHETTAFKHILKKRSFPFFYVLRHHLPDTLIGIALTAAMSSLVLVTLIFMPSYLGEILHLDDRFIALGMMLAMLCNVTTVYLTGRLANTIKPTLLLKGIFLLSIILIPLSYWLISHHQHILFAGLIILGMIDGATAMLTPLLISNLFSTQIRITGVAVCYNISFTIFGGLAPLIIGIFINLGCGLYLTPAMYLLATITISSLGLLFFKRVLSQR